MSTTENESYNATRTQNDDGSVTVQRNHVTVTPEGEGIAPGLSAKPEDNDKPHTINETYHHNMFHHFKPLLDIGNNYSITNTGALNAPNVINGSVFGVVYNPDTLQAPPGESKMQILVGGNKNDQIFGDRIAGHPYTPKINISRDGQSWALETTENNIEYGLAGDDYLEGGHMRDKLVGGPGKDVLVGLGGNDELNGSNDDVHMLPREDNAADIIDGGDGNDNLYLYNNDTGYGGPGADRFHMIASSNITAQGGPGTDEYRNFGSTANITDGEGTSIYIPNDLTFPLSGEPVYPSRGESKANFTGGAGEYDVSFLVPEGATNAFIDIENVTENASNPDQIDAKLTWKMTNFLGQEVVIDQVDMKGLSGVFIGSKSVTHDPNAPGGYSAQQIASTAVGGKLRINSTP